MVWRASWTWKLVWGTADGRRSIACLDDCSFVASSFAAVPAEFEVDMAIALCCRGLPINFQTKVDNGAPLLTRLRIHFGNKPLCPKILFAAFTLAASEARFFV